ncbi:dynein regulatory complex subunit 5 [Hylobates moloch]|uniref:dynein regulatory complex subunit 5 n=1 Tax=Hylobates moloch TaxID=81572 RepID=UPI001363F8B9|nr:dynein regulatory complex subunit 5 [Hylobates moloch]XP_058288206.1 dynein regulatory complex subunit 5 [Hylobates moloch]XP_058288207.1 dynein regulatory complex subunit 5 [Hylobates moloch]XP_058288208.1 dynein regulatory complex subunit 5 [Hylobates moloch]XP_058288209.1 dynein regulatory complex subunit 5 [Hylobates moloch]XP_058288210.1 dynein regulatory complex subunit 5 [Hylobates moloch]
MQDTVTTSALLDPSHSSVSIQDKSSTGGHSSSTGPQLSKPSITPVPAKSRNPHPGANFHRMRRIIAEDPEWSLAIVPLLTELCIQHIIRNFQKNPILKQMLPEHQQKVLNHLSPDLPLAVTANLIDNENYWLRCCMHRWPVCHVAHHGGSWKRMFFERHLENLLKHFIPGTTDPAVILDLLPLCRNYVRRVHVDQFLPPVQLPAQLRPGGQSDSGSEEEMEEPTVDHYQLGDLVAGLSHLEELDLVYDVKDCGMNFEWNLFLFTYRDCHSLAAAIKACHTLKIFKLTRSKVDDDKARIIIRSLLDHPVLEELDLSQNLIGDRGARGAAKLLSHSRLRVLNLANNQVRAPGAQSLAHALAHNTNLISLNLRLNCIKDEGGQALAHALQTNKCLTTLHLGGNELSEPTATLLSQVLAINTTLTSINLSCNHIGLDGGKQLLEGMSDNKTLLEFDLRLSDVAQESEYLIGQALHANREAARQRALNPSHFMSTITANGPENSVG